MFFNEVSKTHSIDDVSTKRDNWDRAQYGLLQNPQNASSHTRGYYKTHKSADAWHADGDCPAYNANIYAVARAVEVSIAAFGLHPGVFLLY